jgi:hypothetical protein
MKKIGLICLALVLALGALGVGYALWYQDVIISGSVDTGYVCAHLMGQKSNDPGEPGSVTGYYSGNLDPAHGHQPFSNSYWSGIGSVDPASWSWVGDDYGKNVAACNCTINQCTLDELTFTIVDGYPSYGPDVAFVVQNCGTIPVKISSIKLTSVTTPNGTYTKDIDVDANYNTTAYMVDNYGNVTPQTAPVGNAAWDPGFDDEYAFTFVITSLAAQPLLYTQIEPEGYVWGDVGLHVAQSAIQDSVYSFTLKYTFAQWNEVP